MLVVAVFTDLLPASVGFSLGLLLHPDDGGDVFHRNIINANRTTLLYIPKVKNSS
jgi:hypothetical protein